MKTTSSRIFLFAEGYRTVTSGCRGAPCDRRYGRELVSFKPGDFFQEKFGGGCRSKTLKKKLSGEVDVAVTVACVS